MIRNVLLEEAYHDTWLKNNRWILELPVFEEVEIYFKNIAKLDKVNLYKVLYAMNYFKFAYVKTIFEIYVTKIHVWEPELLEGFYYFIDVGRHAFGVDFFGTMDFKKFLAFIDGMKRTHLRFQIIDLVIEKMQHMNQYHKNLVIKIFPVIKNHID